MVPGNPLVNLGILEVRLAQQSRARRTSGEIASDGSALANDAIISFQKGKRGHLLLLEIFVILLFLSDADEFNIDIGNVRRDESDLSENILLGIGVKFHVAYQ